MEKGKDGVGKGEIVKEEKGKEEILIEEYRLKGDT